MTRHIKIILTLLFLICCSLGQSQNSINYLDICYKTIRMAVDEPVEPVVNLNLNNLLAIDTLKISKGLYEYRLDLGSTYHSKANTHRQIELYDTVAYIKFCNLAIVNLKKCIAIDRKRGEAYEMLCFHYSYWQKQPDKVNTYLKLYKKHTKKKFWHKETINLVENEK